MKKRVTLSLLVVAAVMLLASCASSSGTTRVDTSTVIDLTGYWNETDVATVCNTVIGEVLSSGRIASYKAENGRLPVFVLGKIANKSDEHIETEIISNKLRNAIINSGRADFVASSNQREELRDERADQSVWASEDQAKSVANEDAADFMVQGSVRTIVQKSGNTTVRQYYLYIEIVDIETGRIIFTAEDDSIKKVVKQASTKF